MLRSWSALRNSAPNLRRSPTSCSHVVHAGIVADVEKVDAKLIKLEKKVEDYLQASMQEESIEDALYAARVTDLCNFRLELVPKTAGINTTLLRKRPNAVEDGGAARRVAYVAPDVNNEAEVVQPKYHQKKQYVKY